MLPVAKTGARLDQSVAREPGSPNENHKEIAISFNEIRPDEKGQHDAGYKDGTQNKPILERPIQIAFDLLVNPGQLLLGNQMARPAPRRPVEDPAGNIDEEPVLLAEAVLPFVPAVFEIVPGHASSPPQRASLRE